MTKQRKRDAEATKAALLDSAEEVFLEKGFGSSTLAEISKRSGITKSLIHHYFGSKAGVWREVKERGFAKYLEEKEKMMLLEDPTEDNLRAYFSLFFNNLKENKKVVKIMTWMFLEPDNELLLEQDRERFGVEINNIKAMQAAGLMRDDIDPRFILFTISSLAFHWFQTPAHEFEQIYGTKGLPEDLDEAYLDVIHKVLKDGISLISQD